VDLYVDATLTCQLLHLNVILFYMSGDNEISGGYSSEVAALFLVPDFRWKITVKSYFVKNPQAHTDYPIVFKMLNIHLRQKLGHNNAATTGINNDYWEARTHTCGRCEQPPITALTSPNGNRLKLCLAHAVLMEISLCSAGWIKG
jgi:hypothetical protein